jgi:SAM-dependent methyltransferase
MTLGEPTLIRIAGSIIKGIATKVRPYVLQIKDGHIPFGDGVFDAIVSNQVFEHIQPHLIRNSLREIKRVLKPDGLFLAMFPRKDIWFEGHVGIYFVHRLCRWPPLQLAYLKSRARFWILSKRKYDRMGRVTPSLLDHGNIVYHTLDEINSHWSQVFGDKPTCVTAANMRFSHKGSNTIAL